MTNFTFVGTTHTITATEYSIAKGADYAIGSPMTTQGYVQAIVDVAALAAGDLLQMTVYEKANAGTQRVAWQAAIPPMAQSYVTPMFLLGEGWDVTLKKSAGADRSILSSVRIDASDVNVVSIAADAVAADAVKADAVTKIQAGLPTVATIDTQLSGTHGAGAWTGGGATAAEVRDAILDYALRGGRTIRGHLRRMDALFFGRVTGLLGALVTAFRPGGSVTEYTAAQDPALGTRDEASCAGSETP